MKTKKRIVSLDILKLICAILIVFHHFQQVTGIRYININFFDGKFFVGYLVELFFIISGFVYAYSNRETNFSSFFKNKIVRIYPMAIISIVCIFVVEIINYFVFGSALKTDGLGIWKIFTNITLIFSMGVTTIDGIGINNPLWYCGVLMECYVLYFLIDSVFNNKKEYKKYIHVFLCLLFLGLKTLDISLPFLKGGTYRGLVCFPIGLLINDLIKDDFDNKKLFVFSFFVLIICSFLFIFKYDLFFDRVWEILVFIMYPSLIYLFLYINKYVNNIKTPILGSISYEMYIWHSFLLEILMTLQRSLIIDRIFGEHFLILMIVFTFVVILFAFILSKYIEPKLNNIARRILNC